MTTGGENELKFSAVSFFNFTSGKALFLDSKRKGRERETFKISLKTVLQIRGRKTTMTLFLEDIKYYRALKHVPEETENQL